MINEETPNWKWLAKPVSMNEQSLAVAFTATQQANQMASANPALAKEYGPIIMAAAQTIGEVTKRLGEIKAMTLVSKPVTESDVAEHLSVSLELMEMPELLANAVLRLEPMLKPLAN